jgi:hypothetical protein
MERDLGLAAEPRDPAVTGVQVGDLFRVGGQWPILPRPVDPANLIAKRLVRFGAASTFDELILVRGDELAGELPADPGCLFGHDDFSGTRTAGPERRGHTAETAADDGDVDGHFVGGMGIRGDSGGDDGRGEQESPTIHGGSECPWAGTVERQTMKQIAENASFFNPNFHFREKIKFSLPTTDITR